MVNLKGDHLYLRALEQSDLEFLYEIENNTAVWEISGTITPYSRAVLQSYLDNAHRDLYEAKQLRLVICSSGHERLGLIDIFDFDPNHKRAGLGVVLSQKHRHKGVGGEAIRVLCDYVFEALDLHQVYANILEDNETSLRLFKKLGFVEVGVKKDWIRVKHGFKNEVLLQKLKS